MITSRRQLPVIAFAMSLMLHAAFLTGLQWTIDSAAAKSREREQANRSDEIAMILPEEMPQPPDQLPEQEEKSREIELGIDAPNPPSPSWIGHEEPQPQLAEQFPTEQAAFTDEPVAAAPPPPSAVEEKPLTSEPAPDAPAQQHNPTPEQAPAEESKPTQVRPNDTPVENEQHHEHEIGPEDSTLDEVAGDVPSGAHATENPDPQIEPLDAANLERIAAALSEFWDEISNLDKRSPQAAESQAAPATESSPASSSQSNHQPQEPKPQVGPQAQEAEQEIGTPADLESSPTSIVDVPPEQWQLGKPLARHGLQLKPRRPIFTLLTLMTASPGNPLCVIKFGADGVPVDAELLRSSGDKRVDDAVLASLFRWRAEGAELQKIPKGKTLDVQMRIILNRRAAVDEERRAQAGPSN